MGQLNEGLVYTNENCQGCNKCISACPLLQANHAILENGNNIISVDGDACIHCGNCIRECSHDARSFHDDTDQFFEDLGKGSFFPQDSEHQPFLVSLRKDEIHCGFSW